MRAREPRLAGGIAGQLTDHAHLLAEVDRLLDDRDGGQAALDAEGHREAVTALLTRLVRHRARGARLVHEAYDVDLGGSG